MESKNVFMEKSCQPTETMISENLGRAYSVLEEIRRHIKANYGDPITDWKFYSPKYGWTMKTFLKKRNLFFVSIYKSSFRISFVFGDRAVEEVKKSSLPEEMISELVNARKYAEGRGLSFVVKFKKDATIIKELIDIKIAN